MFSALDISLWFLAKNHAETKENLSDDENYEVYEGITHLKLQKLLYFAQGIFLSCNNGTPLFKENIKAWTHGPVVEKVYEKYKTNKRNEINTFLTEEEIKRMVLVEKDPNARKALELTYEGFAGYTAWQLRNKTHEMGTPWDITIKTKGEGTTINPQLIKTYFDNNVLEG